jgi:hypothetical protein
MSSRRSSLLRRAKQGAAALGGVALLGGGFVGYLHTSSGNEWIRGKVEARLGQRVNGAARLGGLGFSLGSGLTLRQLSLKDLAGTEVVYLEEAHVEPSLRQLMRGKVDVNEVRVRGVKLKLEQLEEGGTNLSRLFAPKPGAEPPEPPKPSKPLEFLRLSKVSLTESQVELKRLDGSWLTVKGIAVEARVEASPARKDVDALVSRLGASIELKKPDGQQVTVGDLSTGLEAKLQGGSGQVKLLPLAASLGLALPDGRKVDPTPIGLAGLSVGLSQEQVTAGLQQLQLLALQAGSVEARVGMASGSPNGTGGGSLGGVRLDKEKVNALLGKPLLVSHVDLEAKVDGSREKPSLDVDVKTDGGAVKASLRLDASGASKPRFVVNLSSGGLAVHQAVQLKDGAEVELGPLAVAVQGEATSREDAAASITLDLGPTRVRQTSVDKVHAEGRYENGVLTLKNLTVDALGQKLEGRGTFKPATRDVDLRVEARGDLPSLGKALAAAGRKPPPPGLLRGVNLGEGVALEVRGSLDQNLEVAVPGSRIGVAGGSATVEARGRLRKGADPSDPSRFVLEEGGASVQLNGVSIPALMTMLGKPDRGLKGRIDGGVRVHGPQAAPSADYDLRVTLDRGAARVRAHARGKASRDALAMVLDADKLAGGTEDRLLHAEIKAPLVVVEKKPRLDPGRALSIKVDVPSRTLGSLMPLLPRELAPNVAQSTVSASLALEGPARAPEGNLHLEAQGPLASKLGGVQRVKADVGLSPKEGGAVRVNTQLQAWLREDGEAHLLAKLGVDLDRSPLVKAPEKGTWDLDTTLRPQALAALIPGNKARRGTVGLHLQARGDRSSIQAKLDAALRDLGPAQAPPIHADASLALEDERTSLDLRVRGADEDLATLAARAGLGGRGLLTALQATLRPKDGAPPVPPVAGLNTPFEMLLSIPERTLASLGPWVPALREAPGKLGGKIEARGPATRASLQGAIAVQDLPTADGSMARAELSLSGSALQLSARLDAKPASGEGLAIEARTAPLMLLNARKNGAPFPVTISVTGQNTKLSSLIPPTPITRAVEGTVDSDLQAQLDILATPEGNRPTRLAFQGGLKLRDGSFKMPGSQRVLRGLGLQLLGDGSTLDLKQLEAHEADRAQPDRSLSASGRITFEGAAPQQATLDLKAAHWLVAGGRFGPNDAPRASLNADLGVTLAMTPDVRKIHTKIRSLDLSSPDRFLRAHQQEEVTTGDLIEVKSAGEVGKLPVPAVSEPRASATAPEAAPAVPAGRVTEIEIELPPTAHVKQAPLDLQLTGTVRVRIDGRGRQTEGKLAVVGGSILIGGRAHRVEGGELRFDAENPGGYFDIYFQRSPHEAALRDVATEGGEAVRIHLTGPLGKQAPSYEGLGVGSLFDTLAINNAGRTRYLSQPDMPASQAAQLPQYMQLRQMTYMAVNLPHLLFLDRISVWADPYDDRSAYGRLFHHRGERYAADGSTRVRTTTRPPRGIGQSEGEVAYDLLFQNSARSVSGVGLKAGTRGGGGPELFWEWSSKE